MVFSDSFCDQSARYCQKECFKYIIIALCNQILNYVRYSCFRGCDSYEKPPDVDSVNQTCADVQEGFLKEPLMEGEVINFMNVRLLLLFC